MYATIYWRGMIPTIEDSEICRIFQMETLYGTYYLPQRLVTKRRWYWLWLLPPSSEWMTFCIESSDGMKYFLNCGFDAHSYESRKRFESLSDARRTCNEYLRVWYGDKVIQTWKLEDTKNG